jgi:hypothetical protein
VRQGQRSSAHNFLQAWGSAAIPSGLLLAADKAARCLSGHHGSPMPKAIANFMAGKWNKWAKARAYTFVEVMYAPFGASSTPLLRRFVPVEQLGPQKFWTVRCLSVLWWPATVATMAMQALLAIVSMLLSLAPVELAWRANAQAKGKGLTGKSAVNKSTYSKAVLCHTV